MARNKFASLALAALFATAAIGLPQSQAGDRRARGDDLGATRARAFSGLRVRRWEADRPFFPNRWLVTPYDRVGVFYEPHLSCWTWVPMNSGWQRLWDCKNPEQVPHGQFVPPFAPISTFYAYGPSYPSCWTRLPTRLGWRRTWVCNWPYGLGYAYN
jgi:hypothetical protein